MSRRRFTAPLQAERCTANVVLKDGSGAQCMHRATRGDRCWQHATPRGGVVGTPEDLERRRLLRDYSVRRFMTAVEMLRGMEPDLSLYVASGTLCLMSGPSHDEQGRPLRDNVVESAGDLRISGGDW